VSSTRRLVPLLAAFTSLVVLTTDVYLPVLPQLGHDLGTSDAAAAATVSAVLVGIAAGQVVIGPLSDAFGRRLPLLLGAVGYALTHVLSALSPNIAVLLVARVLVGLCTASCLVVGRAIISDVYPGALAARGFATLGAVTGIAPVVAPLLGGALAHVMDWRGMFGLLAGLALLLTAVGARRIPETLPVERRIPPHVGEAVRELGVLLTRQAFAFCLLTMATVGGLLFGYIGASAFVLQQHFGLSSQDYSFVFAANSIGIVSMSWTTRHFVVRVGAPRLLLIGQVAAVVGTAVIAVGTALDLLALVLAGLFVAIGSLGLVMPSITMLALAHAPDRAGSASGLIGIVQFSAGALCSPLAGAGGSVWSFVAVLGTAAVLGLAVGRLTQPQQEVVSL
jgi:DHA1 family bicyclomycin/chloramphenicol resistance-like MFS transporter